MNWVKVIFDEQRTVYVNTKELGDTNEILYLGESGTYNFDLGEPKDYQPPEQEHQISGSSRKFPYLITFKKVS